jgi:hypothetical protein
MTTPIYFTDGKLVAESGYVRVYEWHKSLYLEKGPGHNLWADSNEIEELRDQIDNLPTGDCLEIGLGLGVASQFILSKDISSLTTVEIDIDVIRTYQQLNPPDGGHWIICQSGADFMLSTENTYDFIFLDFYDRIDEDTLEDIKDHVNIAKTILRPGGEIVGWFDIFTPEEFVEEFFELFENEVE